MNTYITMIKYSEEGVKNLKGLPERLEGVKAAISAAGGKFKDYYLTLGQYDAIVITEGPSDVTVAKIVLNSALNAHFSSQTFRAFTMEETREIVSALP